MRDSKRELTDAENVVGHLMGELRKARMELHYARRSYLLGRGWQEIPPAYADPRGPMTWQPPKDRQGPPWRSCMGILMVYGIKEAVTLELRHEG